MTGKADSLFNEKSEIRKEDIPKLKDLLNSIEDDPKSYEFREPVKWRGTLFL